MQKRGESLPQLLLQCCCGYCRPHNTADLATAWADWTCGQIWVAEAVVGCVALQLLSHCSAVCRKNESLHQLLLQSADPPPAWANWHPNFGIGQKQRNGPTVQANLLSAGHQIMKRDAALGNVPLSESAAAAADQTTLQTWPQFASPAFSIWQWQSSGQLKI